MLLIIILAICSVVFLGLAILFTIQDEHEEVIIAFWGGFFVLFILLVTFGIIYIFAFKKVHYINTNYEKNYTTDDYFFNEDMIKLELENPYDLKIKVDK